MTTALTVIRRRNDGSSTTDRLVAMQDGTYVVRTVDDKGAESDRLVTGMATAREAMRRSSRLHVAHIEDRTSFTCHDPSLLPSEDVVATLRTRGAEAPALDADLDLDDDPFVDANHDWFTRHHITVDGTHVFGAAGTPLVVHADDLDRPYESWPEIISFSWDSSDYAGVGAAGFGTSGGYRPRPDLLAIVLATDENLDITFVRIPPHTNDQVLVRRTLDAGVFSNGIYAHLALQAFGCDAEDLMPGDSLATVLDPAQIRRLLLQHHPGPPSRATKGAAR